jgi:hypothetical protein
MANSDKDILITPSKNTANLPEISFVGLDNAPIKLRVLDDNTLSWEGSAGQLFSINNNLTSGSIFSVNDVSGIPSIDVNADGAVSLAPYNGNVAVGHTSPSVKLHVKGNVAGSDIARFENGTVQIDDSLNQNNWQLQVTNSNNAFNQSLIRAEYTGANAAANVKLFSGTYGATENVSITADGSLSLKGSFIPSSISIKPTTNLANNTSVTAMSIWSNVGNSYYPFLRFVTAYGGLALGCDDSVIIGAGESIPTLQNNIAADFPAERVILAGESGVRFYSSSNNWSTWASRYETHWENGNLYLNVYGGGGKLYTKGDPMWIDDYGIFKSNRNTIAETLTIPANTNCMSAGPLTINNGYTITIADGASWSIV